MNVGEQKVDQKSENEKDNAQSDGNVEISFPVSMTVAVVSTRE